MLVKENKTKKNPETFIHKVFLDFVTLSRDGIKEIKNYIFAML